MNIGEILFRINGDSSGAEKSIQSISNKLNSFGGLLKGIITTYGGKKLFDFTIGGNADFEQYKTSFDVVLKSADEAQKKLDYLSKFAADTPFENEPLVQASILLENANLQTEKYLTTIGNTTAAFEKFGATVPEVTKPLTKLASGQTGEALERLRDFGITTRDLMQKGIKFDKGGSVVSSIKDTMDAVIAVMDEKYGGMMEKQSKTFNGLMSTLKDNVASFGRKIGEDVFDKLKTKQSEFMNAWDKWSKDGTLDKAAGTISSVLLKIVDGFTKGVEFAAKYSKEILALVGAVASMSAALKIASTAQAVFNTVTKANPYVAVASAIIALVGGIVTYAAVTKEATSQTYETIRAKKNEIDETDKLLTKYEELKNKSQQTTEEKTQLHEIEKRLAQLYPEVANGIDSENNKYVTQISLVKQLRDEKDKYYRQDLELAISKGKTNRDKWVNERDQAEADMNTYSAKVEELLTQKEELEKKREIPDDPDADITWKKLYDMPYQIEDAVKNRDAALKEYQEKKKLLDEYAENYVSLDKLKNPQNYQSPNSYEKYTGYQPTKQTETTTTKTYAELDTSSRGGSSKSEKNEALEYALKLMEHSKKLNQLSLEDEITTLQQIKAAYAKNAEEIMDIDERIYSAEMEIKENKYQKSVNWINQEKELGRLSTQDEIAAWTRVYQNQSDNIEAVKEATKNLYKLRKQLLQEEIDERTKLSEQWVESQKKLDSFTGINEVAAYNRMITYHKEYLDKVLKDEQISLEEKKKVQTQEESTIKDLEEKIYDIKKEYVEKSVNEYIDKKKKQFEEEENLEEERLNDKLKAIDKEYEEIESKEKARERSSDLKELKKQEKYYKNAVTKEGKEKLKSIQDEIAKIEDEQLKEKREKEKESRKEAVEKEIKDNKTKYKKMREDLETEQKQLLSAAATFTSQSNEMFSSASEILKDSLLKSMQEFDKQQNTMISEGLKKLRTFVNDYKKIASEINGPSTSSSDVNSSGVKNTWIFNDNGDKYLEDGDAVNNYGSEIYSGMQNASRKYGVNS